MKFEKIKGSQNHHLFRPYDKNGKIRDVYWVRIYKSEKGRLEESLRTNQITDARILRDKRIAEFLGVKPRFSGSKALVEDKFPIFIDLKEVKSKGTYENVERAWRVHFKDAFGHLPICHFSSDNWTSWVIEKRKKDPDLKFDTLRQIMQNFINWCVLSDFISKKILLPRLDIKRKAGKVYSVEELKCLLDSSKSDPRFHSTHLQILMGSEMMMRHGEIWSLEWSQIDFKKRVIHLPAAKTKIRRARTFGISDSVLKLLEALCDENRSQWVFPSRFNPEAPAGRNSSNNLWAQLKKLTGVHGRFHDLRHTGLTHSFKISVNPALICEFAGVSMEVAQDVYLHFTPEDTRVVASLFKAVV